MTTAIMFVVTLILVPMLITEGTSWLPWLASRLIRLAVAKLPIERQARYSEEWAAEFDALPGAQLTKLAFALRLYVRARNTAAVLREEVAAARKQALVDGPMDVAARVLSLAQQTADEAIFDAHREADAILAQATGHANALLQTAQSQADAIIQAAHDTASGTRSAAGQ